MIQQPDSTQGCAPVGAPPSGSTAEFARHLRARAEDALATSVHHASISRQYLVLAQKLTILASRAAPESLPQLKQLLQMVERESETGMPAAPISPGDAGAFDAVEWPPAAGPTQQTPPKGLVTEDNPTGDSPSGGSGRSDVMADDKKNPDQVLASLPELPDTGAADPVAVSDFPKTAGTAAAVAAGETGVSRGNSTRKERRPPKRIRRARALAERIRLMAPLMLERIRIRTRKSDLKPRLRTTTEELQKSRNPALLSSVLLGIALLVMALMQMEISADSDPPLSTIIASFGEEPEPVPESQPIEPPAEEAGEQQEQETEPAEDPQPEPPPESDPEPEEEMEEPATETAAAEALPESDTGTEPVEPKKKQAGMLSSRTGAGRQALLQKFGGSVASESAVQRALEWLAARQRSDGSWDFTDVGESGQPGTVSNPIGATAYALLPFLGAGQTHQDRSSPFRQSIEAGLSRLIQLGVRVPAGTDFRGVLNKGNRDAEPNEAYYVHGAATLVLCEAFAMTKDRRLKIPAEGAVRFLVNSQDPRGGGWRYLPQQAGSTSATAIQVMALMAADKAGIEVPESSLRGVSFYLDSVQIDKAGRYGYEVEKKAFQISVSAMALLSRMYLGWDRDDGDLRAGVALLDQRGPYENLYYDYFATQVMRNWGGAEWERWNGRLRDDLIGWQETDGAACGSWRPRDRSDYSRAGGRLLTTCLATLTLEVYYRYQPLLPEASEDEDDVQSESNDSLIGDTPHRD